jgi:hypothetical protein
MKAHTIKKTGLCLLICCWGSCLALGATASTAKTPAKAPAASKSSTSSAKKTATAASAAAIPEITVIPKSVFEVPANAKEGQDPFYPPVKSQPAASGGKSTTTRVDVSVLVLNGISGPPKRLAMINGRTFEPGETGEVKLRSGARMTIQCLEVKETSAVILVGGERQELTLRNGL